MKDSIIFYRSFYEAIQDLQIEQQAQAYNAIFAYALDEQEPKLTGIVATVFKLIKPQLDANLQRYKNGAKGGRPKNLTETETKPNHNLTKTEHKPKPNQTITETEPNVNDNVNDNDNVNENHNHNVFFKVPPKKNDVFEYFKKHNVSKEIATKFWTYYESVGWMRNQLKITNWQSAADYWMTRVDKSTGSINYATPD